MSNIKIYAFADEAGQDLNTQISAMKRTGIDGLEIRAINGMNVKDISNYRAKEIKKAMDDNGLEIWSLGSPMGKISIKDNFYPHLDNYRRLLEINEILGAKAIRLFSFYMPKDEDPTIYRDEVIERLNKFVEVAKDSGILVCHENEKGIYGDNAQRCLDILENVKGLHGIFDPANFIQCNQDTMEAWEMLKEHISYMHIKDCLSNGTVVPAGEGIGNIAAISKDFISRGGKCFTMEPHLFEFIGLSNLEREGDKTNINEKRYKDSNEAFDAAVCAFKNLI